MTSEHFTNNLKNLLALGKCLCMISSSFQSIATFNNAVALFQITINLQAISQSLVFPPTVITRVAVAEPHRTLVFVLVRHELNAVRVAVRAGTAGHGISLATLLVLDVLGLHLNGLVVQRAAALLLQHLHQTLLGSAHVHDLLHQHVPTVTVFTLERLNRKGGVVGRHHRLRVVLVRNGLSAGLSPLDQARGHDRDGDGDGGQVEVASRCPHSGLNS